MNQQNRTILHAYEVYSLIGGGYSRRQVHGYAWTKADAELIGRNSSGETGRYHVGSVHLIEVNGSWHRVQVNPIDDVVGDPDSAEMSRIVDGSMIERRHPAILFKVPGQKDRRLGLNLEQAIDKMAAVHTLGELKLYTMRSGAKPALYFTAQQLREDAATQQNIVEWLRNEIDVRLA